MTETHTLPAEETHLALFPENGLKGANYERHGGGTIIFCSDSTVGWIRGMTAGL